MQNDFTIIISGSNWANGEILVLEVRVPLKKERKNKGSNEISLKNETFWGNTTIQHFANNEKFGAKIDVLELTEDLR